jgi:pimeloyl-ACP methyl ester carboxylesterase
MKVAGLLCGLSVLSSWAVDARADSELDENVALRPGVTSSIHVSVRDNPRYRGHCIGPTVAFVHGLAHTASTWAPLVDEMFATGRRGLICRALLIDLPGHGKSGLPTGLAFGELLLGDYATAVIGALDALRAHQVRAHALFGHSMGGLLIESVQARLLSDHDSLARRYGIHSVVLMSPTPAAEHPWAFAESGAAAATVGSFVTFDPQKGPVVRVDPATWSFFFFTNFNDAFSPGVSSAAEIDLLGYVSDEAAFAGSELVGAAPFARPSVGVRPFDLRHGTFLSFVSPSQDKFSLRSEAEAAYVQLTGDTRMHGFVPIDDEFAVHDMHVAEPRRFLRQALSSWFW